MKTSSLLVFLLNATVIAVDWLSTVNWWKIQADKADHDQLNGVVSDVAMLKGNGTEFQARFATQDAEIAALKAANATANAKIATQEAEITQLKADMQLMFKTVGPMISPPSSPPPPPMPAPTPQWVLGGTDSNHPGYGCLNINFSGANDVVVAGVVTLDNCKAQCLADARCKSLDFYVALSRSQTCQFSYSNYGDVGSSITGTTDCRYYELTRATSPPSP